MTLASVYSGAQPPSEAPGPSQEQFSQDVSSLLDYGRVLYLCALPDYAMGMFSLALDQTREHLISLTRVRAESEAAIFACKTNQPERARPLVDAIKDKIGLVDVPHVRFVANLAIGYGALSNRLGTAARAQGEEALRDALLTGRADLEADALLLLGKALLEERNATDAMQTAQRAMQALTRAGKNLEKSEIFSLIAECHMAQRNPAAAAIAGQRAREVIQNTGEGPLLNLQTALREAPVMISGHFETALSGNYEKAFHEILSLLILNKFQSSIPRQTHLIRELNLSEPLLLAYAGHYAHLRGARQPARVFIALAESALPRETAQRNKVECFWALAAYWRMAGNTEQAAQQLVKAEQAIRGLANLEPRLQAGILEETALVVLQQPGGREQAVSMLSAALEITDRSGPAHMRERLEFYRDMLARGQLDPAVFSGGPNAYAEALRRYKRTRISENAPPFFRSLFTADALPGQDSAAAAIAKLSIPRPVPRSAVDMDPGPYIQTGRWARAIAILEAALDEEGDSLERWQMLGECYYNTANFEKAEHAFRQVLRLDPNHARAAVYLRDIQSRPGKTTRD